METLRKKERAGSKQDETQFTTKKWCFSEFHPPLMQMHLFAGFTLKSSGAGLYGFIM
jgi:hypothetical protein